MSVWRLSQVRLREGPRLAYSALSPALQGQLALAGPETTWVRAVWWLRDRSAPFLVDLAKEMVNRRRAQGARLQRKRRENAKGIVSG